MKIIIFVANLADLAYTCQVEVDRQAVVEVLLDYYLGDLLQLKRYKKIK